MKKIHCAIITLFLLVGCSVETEDQGKREAIKETLSTPTIVATDLQIPWTITKTNGAFYITQRIGKIFEIDEATGSKKQQSLRLTKEVLHEGEGGLLGFALAPDFDDSRLAYAYHTYLENNKIFNRVILVEKAGDTWEEKAVHIDRIPGGIIHNGGRLRIGPDMKLYVTTGDAGVADSAQDPRGLAGKILRLNLDGSIPQDNPFTNSYVYSYGHRNPQGLAWDDAGTLYSTEHGQSAHDEINIIKPGQNYGWPLIQGDEEAPNMIKPLYHTNEYTWAPSGIEQLNGKLYIATLRDSKIRSYDLKTGKIDVMLDITSRMRDVFIQNGTLFTITNNRDGRGTPKKGDDKLLSITGIGDRQ
ncbi:PQQ-dependent sugar dehydrogenase [Fredinandcohnia sp. 179-A 10B2 NHS]|uniref:PQQ-dependent sugar dehydrogenase n=1 Tax=Fredinandcohnia sp. 179-A 10B2 NHS TaxID=3235176 RepID=UPI0039A04639